ncbi:MAG: hypothetical protein AAF611_10610 [Bacteroidota bacterium]
MENNYSENIERWAHEDMLQLAHHFHRLEKTKEQYERITDFIMNKINDVPTFESLKTSIKRLRIYMALDTQDKEAFTFFPVLQVLTTTEATHYFKLHAVEGGRSHRGESEIVPALFKNILCKNWDVIDLNLIDDLFIATKKSQYGFDTIQRVKYFEISTEIITNVIQKLPELTGITFYSGIDLNKFSDKTQISFTPVLGFQYEAQSEEMEYGFGLQSVMEFTKGEVFIEYSSPCPPTC